MNPGRVVGVAFVVIIVLIAVSTYVRFVQNKKRQAAFSAWAGAHGFAYAERDDAYNDLPWGSPFGTGHGWAAFDVLTGDWQGRPALCFTYRYQTTSSNGKTSRTENHWFAIHSLRLPKALPGLRVSREGLFGTIARAVGVHDIELESEQFNKTFKVKCDDRKLASDVLHPRLMEWLLGQDAPGFTIAGPDLVVVAKGRLQPTAIEGPFGYLQQIADSVPGFVWNPR